MSKKPLVSIVMPAYNAEKYIARAIESILNQTFENFELLIIDDASTDKTKEIIKRFHKKDHRIVLVENKQNLQISKTLNLGISFARAGIIARMDADDMSLPNRIKLQYEYLEKHPKIAIVGANIIVVDEKGEQLSTREYPEKSKELKRIMFRYSPFAHPVVMFRKKAFERFGGYDSTKVPCEDIDLWFKLGSKYEFGTVSQYVMRYTILKNSNSNKKLRDLELLGFKIKIEAIIKYGYRPSIYDVFYNIAQFLSLWFTPAPQRVWLYNFLRSRKII